MRHDDTMIVPAEDGSSRLDARGLRLEARGLRLEARGSRVVAREPGGVGRSRPAFRGVELGMPTGSSALRWVPMLHSLSAQNARQPQRNPPRESRYEGIPATDSLGPWHRLPGDGDPQGLHSRSGGCPAVGREGFCDGVGHLVVTRNSCGTLPPKAAGAGPEGDYSRRSPPQTMGQRTSTPPHPIASRG